MKKKIIIAAGAVLIAAASFAAGAGAATGIKLYINGKQINADLQIINDSSYVLLRVVSESLGANVVWDNETRSIRIAGKIDPSSLKVSSAAQSFDANTTITSGAMKMTISKITLDPAYQADKYSDAINALVLDVSIENTSTDTLTWYPVQGTIALNTKEQVSDGIMHSENVDGEFVGNVVKTGKIVFEVKSNLSDITSIKYKINGSSNGLADIKDPTTTDIKIR